MKIIKLIKNEIKTYNIIEISFFLAILCLIIFNAIYFKDSPIAVISAISGMLYTINAGKGKIICYFYGLLGSFCYSYLAFKNAFWGNLALYFFYYIPSEITGIFLWKKHIKKETNTIIKTKLSNKNRLILLLIAIFGSIILSIVLKYFNDSNPFVDGFATFLSIIGMYLTLRRLIEQWYIWAVVNFLSCAMWIGAILKGEPVYSTATMWFAYFLLSFYFLKQWKKEV